MAWHRPTVSVTSDINVTPLVDVMLVLLIIFMVITPLLQKRINVRLAQTVNPVTLPGASKDNAVIVAISHDGRIYLGNNMVASSDLSNEVQTAISSHLNKIVYVMADAEAQFQSVAQVVDDIRDAGVSSIALETQKVNRVSLPPSAVGQ